MHRASRRPFFVPRTGERVPGARRFNAALTFAGAHPERPRTAGADSGLAVALGGAGLTLRQLAVYKWKKGVTTAEEVIRLTVSE